MLFFDECEALFRSRTEGNTLMTLLLTEIERFEGVAILATNLPDALDEALDRRVPVKVHFPEPDRLARLEIWRKLLPPEGPLSEDVDIEALADRYECAGGYIKNAVLMAVAAAAHGGGEAPVVTMQHLQDATRDQLRRPREQDEGATLCVTPKARLSDLVLTPTLTARVEELVDAADSCGRLEELAFARIIGETLPAAPCNHAPTSNPIGFPIVVPVCGSGGRCLLVEDRAALNNHSATAVPTAWPRREVPLPVRLPPVIRLHKH